MGTVAHAGLVLIVLIMTYAMANEKLWGAGLMFFNIAFSALIALNFYEPLAKLVFINNDFLPYFSETLCLLVLFLLTLVIFRVATSRLGRTMVRFPPPVDVLGRMLFAVGGAVITAGIILLGFESAPVHEKLFGSIEKDSYPPYGQGFDAKLLTAFGWVANEAMKGDNEFPDADTWLETAQNKRPHGKRIEVPETPSDQPPQ